MGFRWARPLIGILGFRPFLVSSLAKGFDEYSLCRARVVSFLFFVFFSIKASSKIFRLSGLFDFC